MDAPVVDTKMPPPAETPEGREIRGRGKDGAIDRSVTDWYRDAIIYQLHVKAFQDSNNDGMGDFRGLMQRLDHVQDLGVTAVWLLPFYPSPLRDDGYDIADYRTVNPSYGNMKDFKLFVEEAHRRGLRVITELVINHTSDQHPWFQRARRAKAGSAARNFYVWSDTDQKYTETRIIFLDTEKSNWTWDDEAKAFFWHRFYSHQPDLNFDNPQVLKEVLSVMRMWLDMGVDGLRLDAIPYLIERDGTNNENLPETHEILKKIRAALDERYSDRMLLAEANQWPEDTRPYFGEGDECHMCFHFPLMPRMYMALAQEDRHPITDIIRQTPEIPDGCQWAIFLRNHDELTLEMVTAEERDYLWRTYAEDSRARINLGIRRRLAPLMQNDRRKIELLNAFLFSMPGTPVVYYGDEIGMGDNYYLGDRDGVRTPMQWSADRNAGFSRANPQQLYLPPIMDPIYGFQAINVEAQQADPSSLLNWTRRMIAIRKRHPAFGRGTMTFIYPKNRKILAYVRQHGDEAILVVANLSRTAQAVDLDLSAWKGAVPVELVGRAPFPPIEDGSYRLTLPAYAFFWFLLAPEADAPRWYDPVPEPLPDFITVTARGGRIERIFEGREKSQLETDTLPAFLPLQRWFGAKDARIRSTTVTPLASLEGGRAMLALLDVEVGEDRQTYFLPLAAQWGEENLRQGSPRLGRTLAKIRSGPRVGALVDGAVDEQVAAAIIGGMVQGRSEDTPLGRLRFTRTSALADDVELADARPLGVEQSNVSIAFGDRLILKIYRRLRAGEQPDVEVARFLTDVAGYSHTPSLMGTVEVVPEEGEPTTLAAAFAFVPNRGDAWHAVTGALDRRLEEIAYTATTAGEDGMPRPRAYDFPLSIGALAGQRTAELHRALASGGPETAFATEPLTAKVLSGWAAESVREAKAVFRSLEAALPRLDEATAADARALLDRKEDLLARLEAFGAATPSGKCSRIHGDYHLGQVLVSRDDLVVIDFEGEPRRSLAERRAKSSPLRDVAGMLRSFDYAAATALGDLAERAPTADAEAAARAWLKGWLEDTTAAFLSAYREHIAGAPTWPDDPALAEALIDLFVVQKAIYEIGYELANRPGWVSIPVRGALGVLARQETDRKDAAP